MSKPVKNMIVEEYRKRFKGVDNALVIDVRGMNAIDNNGMRLGLHKKNIRVTVVKNSLAKHAFKDSGLSALEKALEGPAAIAYGGSSVVDVAREIVAWAKKVKNLDLKGACLDGTYFDGKAGVTALSKFPTREEAIAEVVQLVLTPGSNLVSTVTGPGAGVVGVVQTIIDKLEKGEAVTKLA